MAQQIKKKYLKDGSVDGSKIKILSGQSIVAENASSQLVELLKINASNKVEAVGQEISYKSELDQEVLDRQSGDSQNSAGLAQEILDRQAAVSAEQSRAEGEENLLKGRMTTAEGDIDSLEGRMMAAESNISNEVSRAEGEENLLKGRVTTAEGDIDSLESRMMTAESNISNEVSRAEGEENLLKGRMTTAEGDIDSLESRMMSAESNISNEVSRAEGEENLLKGRMTTAEGDIDSLESRMMSAENNISNEVSRAENEENLLKGRMTTAEGDIDSLESRMASAESGLSTETADRIAGDANLQSQINNVLSNIDPVALDSLTEVVAAFQAADSDLTAAITALGTGSQSALAQEILDRQADVDAEETRAMGVEASLQSQITQEVSDRQSAVSSEQSRAEGVEAGLQSAINTEVSDRQVAVSAEQSRAMGVEAGLQSAIDAEVLARQSAVSSEESARVAEDLTFFKLDGSRPMVGDIDMGSFDDGNKIIWQQTNFTETFTNEIVHSQHSLNYFRSDTGAYASALFEVQNGLTVSKSQDEILDPETGAVLVPGFSKSVKYSSNGIDTQNAVTFKTGGNIFDTGHFGTTRFVSPEDLMYDNDGVPLLDGYGNQLKYIGKELKIDEYKNLTIYDRSYENGMEILLGSTIITAGNAAFYSGDTTTASIIDNYQIITPAVKLMNYLDNTVFVPNNPEDATPKQYVDQQISNALSTGSSNLVEAKAYTDQKVADLVNSAPEVLDTLKELSDALGGDANFAASVASTIGDVSSRVTAVESITNGKHKVVLSATDITNGYIDLPHLARVESMMGFVDRLAIHNEEDYTVSVYQDPSVYEGPQVTRITFIGELVSPSEQALVAGDTIFFRYEFYSA